MLEILICCRKSKQRLFFIDLYKEQKQYIWIKCGKIVLIFVLFMLNKARKVKIYVLCFIKQYYVRENKKKVFPQLFLLNILFCTTKLFEINTSMSSSVIKCQCNALPDLSCSVLSGIQSLTAQEVVAEYFPLFGTEVSVQPLSGAEQQVAKRPNGSTQKQQQRKVKQNGDFFGK